MTGNNNSPWDPNNQQGHNPTYNQAQQPYQDPHHPQGNPGYGGQPPVGYPAQPYGQPQPQGSNKTPIIIAVVVVALIAIGALVFFLLRGNDDNDTDNRDDRGNETIDEGSQSDDPDTDDSDDTIGTPDTPDSDDQDTEPADEFGDPNADPAAFRAGMEDILAQTGLTEETAVEQGITAEQWDTYLTCVTDESLQRLAPEAIESISNGQDVYDSHSVSELSDIATTCGQEAGTL